MKLPVRRISHPTHQRSIETTRKEIERIAIVSPNTSFNVDFVSSSDVGGLKRTRLLTVGPVSSLASNYRVNGNQTVRKCPSMLAKFQSIYGRNAVEVCSLGSISSFSMADDSRSG